MNSLEWSNSSCADTAFAKEGSETQAQVRAVTANNMDNNLGFTVYTSSLPQT